MIGSQLPQPEAHFSHLKFVFLKNWTGQLLLQVLEVGCKKKYVAELVLMQAVQLLAATSQAAQPA